MSNYRIYTSIEDVEASRIEDFRSADKNFTYKQGICGFDGFIDTFIKMQTPSTMGDFGSRVKDAAGVSASYVAHHNGEKFGGNGPLLASALHSAANGNIDITYIGALGEDSILPIFEQALRDKTKDIFTLAAPAHSDCIEFSDGKIMLSDMRTCEEITWARLVDRMGMEKLDECLLSADFIAAVNWGKLIQVGEIWENLTIRLRELGVPAKTVDFFMDLAEFEQRSKADCLRLIERLGRITEQCRSTLSLNLKEAWQMGDLVGLDYHGKKAAEEVTHLTAELQRALKIDRLIVHPNDGAAIASKDGAAYLCGPYCQNPLISTGAGDHFGAGCLRGILAGYDDLNIILHGVCTGGYFVRSGRSPTFNDLQELLEMWKIGTLPERLETECAASI